MHCKQTSAGKLYTLDLDESQIHRDQICFTMGLYRLLLRIKPTYIYIEVIPSSKDASISTGICTLCNNIRNLIEENIAEACETLSYSDCANYGLSFICPCDLHDQEEKVFHPAQIKNDPVQERVFLCSRSKESTPINPECHVWLPEVSIQTASESAWRPLQLPVEKPWSMPGGPFVFLLAQTGVENAPVRTPFVAFYTAFSPSRSGNTNQGRYP